MSGRVEGLGRITLPRRGRSVGFMRACSMENRTSTSTLRIDGPLMVLIAACILLPRMVAGQSLSGALVGTVKDKQGGILPGALVRVSSPALIGGLGKSTTNEK